MFVSIFAAGYGTRRLAPHLQVFSSARRTMSSSTDPEVILFLNLIGLSLSDCDKYVMDVTLFSLR
jgi:hypothetical protein